MSAREGMQIVLLASRVADLLLALENIVAGDKDAVEMRAIARKALKKAGLK